MPRPSRPVILIEFSELPAVVLDLPNFRRCYAESRVYITEAQQPGTQWMTLHTGLPPSEDALNQKCIWDLVSDHRLRVWVCGSPQTRYQLPLNGCVLPDAATSTVDPHPLALLPYLRIGQGTPRWDVFRLYYGRLRPQLATFFVNATMPLQRDYRNLDALLGRFLRLAEGEATLAVVAVQNHAEGFCWIRTPDRSHEAPHRRVPLRALAPTILRLLGVPIPVRMTAPPLLGERGRESTRPGRALL